MKKSNLGSNVESRVNGQEWQTRHAGRYGLHLGRIAPLPFCQFLKHVSLPVHVGFSPRPPAA